MKILVAGMGIVEKFSAGETGEVLLVLQVTRKIDRLTVIPVTPKTSSGRVYYRTYHYKRLEFVEREIEKIGGKFKIIEIQHSPYLMMSDDEIEKIRLKKAGGSCIDIKIRDERWEIIRDLVIGEKSSLLFEKAHMHDQVQLLAEQLDSEQNNSHLKQKISRTLNQFFAGGSQKNALLPRLDKCGGPGVVKKRGRKKLGRKNAPTTAGIPGVEGLVLETKDLAIIKFCWETFVKRNVSVQMAYRKMCREFYTYEQFIDGEIVVTKLSFSECPTEDQFRYNGQLLCEESAREKQEIIGQHLHRGRALPGSANDGIVAVGQQGSIDSTPTDLELVSILSRKDRIGIANQMIVVDALHGYIPGFYHGLKAACSETVKLTILHAMMPDKTDWLRDLGIEEECPPGDWLPIQFQGLLGDNTDSRAESVFEGLVDQGIVLSLKYIPTYRSDLNAIVEATHHSLHRLAGHKVEGSNFGRRSERRIEEATFRACHTLIESVRNAARGIHAYNTMLLPDKFLTLEMRRDGVIPSRLEMTRWEIENKNISRTLMPIEEARSKLLPLYRGVFTESGVYLLRPDTGNDRVIIRPLRYISSDARVLKSMENARRSGTFEANFKIDPSNIRKIWYLDLVSRELLELRLKIDDEDLEEEATFDDLLIINKKDTVTRYFNKNQQNEVISDLEARIEQSNQQASEDQKNELKKLSKPLSKAEIKGNKKQNRRRENDMTNLGLPININRDDISRHMGACPEINNENVLSNQTSDVIKSASIFDDAVSKKGGEK